MLRYSEHLADLPAIVLVHMPVRHSRRVVGHRTAVDAAFFTSSMHSEAVLESLPADFTDVAASTSAWETLLCGRVDK